MMGDVEHIVPAVLLGIALTNLAVASFRWGAGGKHQVLTSLLMAAIATSMLLPGDTAGRTAALWVAAGLTVVAFMTTPGARLRRMRFELVLLAAALAVMWTVTLVELPRVAAMAAFVLTAALVLAAFLVMIRRAKLEQSQ